MTKLIAIIGGVVGTIAIIMLLSLLLVKTGWSLFIVPVFGYQELTWMQALGFSLLAGAFKTASLNSKKG